MNRLITRFSGNPILTKEDVPYPVATAHNAAVIKYNHEYIMIFRSHRLNGRSILGLARSSDGYKFRVDSKPFMTPSDEYDEYGVEDPRVSSIDGEYLMTYSAYSRVHVIVNHQGIHNFQLSILSRFVWDHFLNKSNQVCVLLYSLAKSGPIGLLLAPYNLASGSTQTSS